ncbi:lipopolysaccharide biosynthesis protein [uncultured Maribacter sp.]|uniref:lipopolysaccharide biosynthesis protein n=1 Tax=uncultured Maribacter sp. TaxID=431308 RepID=UPI0026286E80|nr:lipopolysaccharide biosynthesis protein [uncultured Maribacter sp.]
MSLRNKAISGFGWTAFEGVFGQGVIFLVGVILARLLTPEDFGIIGIITVFVAIASSLVEGGFSDALIRKSNVNSKDYNTVFYTNLIVSIGIYIIIYAFSNKIADFFHEDILEEILKYSGIIIIINAFTIIQNSIIIIQLNFKILSIVKIISSILSAIVAIYMAYNNFGVWSMVALSILRPLIVCILLWVLNSWRPSFVFSKSSFKDLFSFGYKILISKLINTIYKNIYYFLIGKYFSPADLGYYTRADQFQRPFSVNITQAISRISYPILATFQKDLLGLKSVFRRFLRYSVLLNFTIILMIAAMAKPIILLTVGDKWYPSIYYLQLLCIPGALYPLQILNINLLTSLGYSDLMLRLEVIKKIILIPLLLSTVFISIEAMLYGLILFSIIEYFINSYYAKKLISYSLLEQIKDIIPFLITPVVMFVVMFIISKFDFSLLLMLVLQIFVGLVTFLLINERLQLKEYIEIKSKVISIVKK